MNSAELMARAQACKKHVDALVEELIATIEQDEEDHGMEIGALAACSTVLDMVVMIGTKARGDAVLEQLVADGLLERISADEEAES